MHEFNVGMKASDSRTIVIMPSKIRLANDEIMISIQLPEFTVDHIEVLVWEVLGDQVDVLFRLQGGQNVEEIGASQLAQAYSTWPGGVGTEEDAGNHGRHISRVEFRCCLEEGEAGVGINDILE